MFSNKKKEEMNVKGTCEDKFLKVKELFDELHNTDREIGSSFAVYKDGEPIIDIWGGFSEKNKFFIKI